MIGAVAAIAVDATQPQISLAPLPNIEADVSLSKSGESSPGPNDACNHLETVLAWDGVRSNACDSTKRDQSQSAASSRQ